MTNKLGNTPEKVNSTPNRSGSSMLKKIVAGAIALTLSGQPAEAKAFNKQEFPTEMVANIPGEISPMTENVEQSTLPNYIKQAENGVRKYYPQYENYFKPIFTRTYKLSTSSQNIINKKIQENFEFFEEELPTEKDRVTTILLVLERIIAGQDGLAKEIKGNGKDRSLIEIAEEIGDEANKQAKADRERINNETAVIKKRNNKLEEIINSMNSNKTPETIIVKIEEYLDLFDIKDIKNNSTLKEIIERYIKYTKKIKKTPSQRGKMFIEEYNRIINK